MIPGPDNERYLRLTKLQRDVERLFNNARRGITGSYDALNKIVYSTETCPVEVFKRAERALIIETSFTTAAATASALRDTAIRIAHEPDNGGDILSLHVPILSNSANNNPTLRNYPDSITQALEVSAILSTNTLLRLIEGNSSLTELTHLPEKSIRFICIKSLDTSLGKIYLFPTSIYGVEMGLLYDGKSRLPDVFFGVPQLHHVRSLYDRFIKRGELT